MQQAEKHVTKRGRELFEPDQLNFSKVAVCLILHIFTFIVSISILYYAVKLFKAHVRLLQFVKDMHYCFQNSKYLWDIDKSWSRIW